jgi:hypothetical protein
MHPDKDTDVLEQAAYWECYMEQKGTPSGYTLTTHIMPLVRSLAAEVAELRKQKGGA